MHSGQNRPFSYWSVIFSIPVLQLIVLETGNVKRFNAEFVSLETKLNMTCVLISKGCIGGKTDYDVINLYVLIIDGG